MGKLLTESLDEVWNGEPFQNFFAINSLTSLLERFVCRGRTS
jgi:hypothetical protein